MGKNYTMNSARRIKLKIKQVKLRNPITAPALLRKAGSHRKSEKNERQQGQRELRRALART
jgi:hypothetical protein